MKKGFISVFLLSALFLASCNGEEKPSPTTTNNALFPTSPLVITTVLSEDEIIDRVTLTKSKSYNLVIGDEFNPFITTMNYKLSSSNESILTVDKNGNIKALSAGDAYVGLYDTDNKLCAKLIFNVREKEVITPNCDEKVFEELQSALAKFNDANSVFTTISFTEVSGAQNMFYKVSQDPFYLEYSMGETTVFVKKINDKYFAYNVDKENKTIEKEYIPNDEFKLSDYSFDFDVATSLQDVVKSNVSLSKLADNKFELIMPLSSMTEISQLMYGASTAGLLDGMVLTEIITINENGVDLELKTSTHVIMSNIVVDNEINIGMNFEFNTVKEFDTTGYEISKPSCIEEIEGEEEITSVKARAFKDTWALTTFEKGYYVLDSRDISNNQNIVVNIYDEELNQIVVDELGNDKFIPNAFKIEKDGKYYITYKSNVSSDIRANLVKLDYELDNEAKDLIGNHGGNIVDTYDYKKYSYTSNDENEIIKIENKSYDKIYLYTSDAKCEYNRNLITIDAGKAIYINPKNGENFIYIISPVLDNYYIYDESYHYSFKATVLVNNNGTDLNNLDQLTTEYGKEYYTGLGLNERTLEINAAKKGVYKIYVKYNGGSIRYDSNDEVYHYAKVDGKGAYDGEFLLDEGKHIVKIGDSRFEIIQLKYEFISIDDKDVDIILPKITRDNVATKSYEDAAIIKTQKVKYHFTLEKETLIDFARWDVSLYDSNDNLLSFKPNHECYYKLPAGSYYIMFNSGTNSSFSITVTNIDMPNAYNPYGNQSLSLNKTYTITSNGANDSVGYKTMAFDISYNKDTNIAIEKNNMYVDLYDSDYNLIRKEYLSSNYGYALEAGKTYHLVAVVDTMWESASLTVREIK